VLPNVGLHPCRQRANQIVKIVGFAGFHWSNFIQDARHLLLTLYFLLLVSVSSLVLNVNAAFEFGDARHR
jgi:hypothetical protein